LLILGIPGCRRPGSAAGHPEGGPRHRRLAHRADPAITEPSTPPRRHPNSLHYRLRRIAEITGHDPRTLAGLLELIAAARLAAPQAAGRPD